MNKIRLEKFDIDWLREIRDKSVEYAIKYLSTLNKNCILELDTDGDYDSNLCMQYTMTPQEKIDIEIKDLTSKIKVNKKLAVNAANFITTLNANKDTVNLIEFHNAQIKFYTAEVKRHESTLTELQNELTKNG